MKTYKGGRHHRRHRKQTGGSVVADALIAVGALAAWKYFTKKGGKKVGGGSRHLPKRHGLSGKKSLAR